MNNSSTIQFFEGKKIRIAWDAEQEKYYFAVADIVQVLTDSVNPRDYIKKMLRRDPELKSKWGTICPPVEMLAPDGKHRKTQAYRKSRLTLMRLSTGWTTSSMMSILKCRVLTGATSMNASTVGPTTTARSLQK